MITRIQAIASIILTLIASNASARNDDTIYIDTVTYFAYVDASDNFGFIATISKKPCKVDAKQWGNGWGKAEFTNYITERRLPACWKTNRKYDFLIDACYLLPNGKNGQCFSISKSKFLDTKSIPSQPNF